MTKKNRISGDLQKKTQNKIKTNTNFNQININPVVKHNFQQKLIILIKNKPAKHLFTFFKQNKKKLLTPENF